MIKLLLINLIPLVVMLAIVFIFIQPKERPVLLVAVIGISILWAGFVYSFMFGVGTLIWMKRKIFGYKKDIYN